MKIKELTWDEPHGVICTSADVIPQLLYIIFKRGEQFELRFFHGNIPCSAKETEHLGYLASMDGAKRTAQTHFEKYITKHFLA